MWAMKLSLISIILFKLELEALIIITEQMTEIKIAIITKKIRFNLHYYLCAILFVYSKVI